MQIARRLIWAGAASLVAGALSIVLFLLFGAALPIWTMMAIYGRAAVQDSPAHGGVILFATLPIAGIISVSAFLFLAARFYRKLRADGSEKPK
jgi:hypothetical protein